MIVVDLMSIEFLAALTDDSIFGVSIVIGGLLLALGFLLFRLADVRVSAAHPSEPYRIVNVGVVFGPGDRSAAKLGDLLRSPNFANLEWRAFATKRLASIVASAELVDGFFDIGVESRHPRRRAHQAQRLYESQAELADVNVAHAGSWGESAPSAPDDTAALLVVVACVRGFQGVARRPRLMDEVRAVMNALAEIEGDEDSWLGFWFTPLPDETMTLEDCRGRFDAVLASTI